MPRVTGRTAAAESFLSEGFDIGFVYQTGVM
jgi:hypothetical protein